MRSLRGLALTFGIFMASFALHIVGGATGQGWLFAVAVVLIFISATGFPVIAMFAAGHTDLQAPPARLTGAIGAVTGYALTVGALWAANGRAFAWWEFPLAMVLVFAVSAALLTAWRTLSNPRSHTAAANR